MCSIETHFLSYKPIWEIENGGVSIGLDLLCRIADSWGVEVRALIEF